MGDPSRRLLPYRYYNAAMGIIVLSVLVYFVSRAEPRTFGLMLLGRDRLTDGRIWTPLTYLFLHNPSGGFVSMHLLFNMLGLYWFGAPVERSIGSSEFLWLYLGAGVAAGLLAVLVSPALVLGASGAVFAVMLVYATLFPDARIVLFFFLPLRAPVAVLVFAGVAIVGSLGTGVQPGIAHIAHLGGLAAGWIYCQWRLGRNPIDAFLRR
jgi:membrane associated rhomboid family serine protease